MPPASCDGRLDRAEVYVLASPLVGASFFPLLSLGLLGVGAGVAPASSRLYLAIDRRAAPVDLALPFTNFSDDREQKYFADGITEDLTTDLSRLAHMFVNSRNTAFTYRKSR